MIGVLPCVGEKGVAVMAELTGWSGVGWDAWKDLVLIRARLAAGADPIADLGRGHTPLHIAAERGSPEVVAELAHYAGDVEADYLGRTALWSAVYADRPDNARALEAAGADPWRPMMAGWSPGRLSLASRNPDLFGFSAEGIGLSAAEVAAVAEGRRLTAALGSISPEGIGLACVAAITAAEAARRLNAAPVQDTGPGSIVERAYEASMDDDEVMHTVGATDVPGGCVVTQPWGFTPSAPVVTALLSTGTVCYAMYGNAKSGNQGRMCFDGVLEGWDLQPGSGMSASGPAEEVLASYLYQLQAVAYCCNYAGLQLTDPRPILGPPDIWLRIPTRDYWN